MSLLVHESHPILVHGPLALLPAAAGVDLIAALRGEPGLVRAGRDLWIAGTLGGLLAGLTGMAASQEVVPSEKSARDMMLLHGVGNLLIVSGALGMSLWRLRHRPTRASSLLGLLAVTAAAYTGYLGGEMVYSHELGVKRAERMRRSPPLFSRQAPGKLARDAIRGARWLLLGLSRALRGEDRLESAAFRGDGVGAGGFQAAQPTTS